MNSLDQPCLKPSVLISKYIISAYLWFNNNQIVDSCMVEGAAYVGSWLFASRDMFVWGKPRGHNFLDSGAHFYETYRTKDGKYLAVGALEPQFYRKEHVKLIKTSCIHA